MVSCGMIGRRGSLGSAFNSTCKPQVCDLGFEHDACEGGGGGDAADRLVLWSDLLMLWRTLLLKRVRQKSTGNV